MVCSQHRLEAIFQSFCRRKQGRRKLTCDIHIVSVGSTRIACIRMSYLGEWAERRTIFAKELNVQPRSSVILRSTIFRYRNCAER